MKKCKQCGNDFVVESRFQQHCSIKCKIIDIGYTINDTCHIWNGCKDSENYGIIGFKRKYFKVHRIMCEMTNETNSKLYALHSCDNPSCINPDHLRWGTQTENMNDKRNRGRQKGEKQITSKLKETEVIDIIQQLKKGITIVSLSKKYNVSEGCIASIKFNRNWKHIPR